jgi:DNA polymerase sigma
MRKVNLPDSFKVYNSKSTSLQSSQKSYTNSGYPEDIDTFTECVQSGRNYEMNSSVSNKSCESAVNKTESSTVINNGIGDTRKEAFYPTSTTTKGKSDAFIIKESPESRKFHTSKEPNDDIQTTEREHQPVVTTLHFKSGLSLPISTKSQTSMKVIANASKSDENKTMPCIASRKCTSFIKGIDNDTNEVHKHVNFDALNNLRSDSCQREMKSSSQIISNSKHSAAQAMMASSILSASRRLASNIRLVYQAASNFSHNDTQNENTSSILYEPDDVIVTFDPSYLSEQSGRLFLDDLERVIRSGLTNSSKEDPFIFSGHETHINDDNASSPLPNLLKPFIESSNNEVSLLFILAARVEDSIRNSYRLNSRKSLQGSLELAGDISQPSFQCHETEGFSKYFSLLCDVYKCYQHLEEKEMLKTIVNLETLDIDSIHLQELLFVPLDRISIVSKSVLDKIIRTDEKIRQLAAKWNNVITFASQLVFPRGNTSISAAEQEVVELFADDVLKNKPTNSKRKKKNKKVCFNFISAKYLLNLIYDSNEHSLQKRKNSSNKVNKTKEDRPNEALSTYSATETVSENANIGTVYNPPTDCAESIASTVSASTVVSKKKQVASEIPASERSTAELKSNATVSKINGVQGVISIGRTEERGQDINDEGWETVESKKGRDKKSSHQGKGPTEKSANSTRKNKTKTKNRNRNRQRKCDSSELDASKKGSNSMKCPTDDRTRRDIGKNEIHDDSTRQSAVNRSASRITNGGDVTYGSLLKSKTRVQNQETLKTCSASKSIGVTKNSASGETGTLKVKSSPLRKNRAVADQNTASTVQETVSATSRSLTNNDESLNLRQSSKLLTSISTNDAAVNMTEVREHSSGSSTIDGTSRSMTPSTRKSSAPPLQTLVGPGNMNSANSSVASSLEAPHATRHGSHKHKSSKEDDVGYHLLNVCERLSEDMNMFMNRRALALSSRRRERSALLNSLQETVQSIWAGRCHVEMYGSCATQLDLPSSDLDVVVCGLDRIEDPLKGNQSYADNLSETGSSSPSSVHSQTRAYHHQIYPHLSNNGHRVIRLATALEKVPWAVQVKAIPTASVPVIKILADSSRLPGAAGMDWMLQQQRMAAAVIAAAEFNSGKMPVTYSSLNSNDRSSANFSKGANNMHAGHYPMSRHMAAAMSGISPSSSSSFHSTMPPWRGADVMNGLLSLDITFEGPEHGGLGSTAFSARVIQEACNETGLPPERTPAVQVLMVIKELLAQRKLNEPFSGGLSSYAILLLVVAVVKERRIINREIERIEKQRQAVERSSVNCDSLQGSKSSTWPYEKQSKSLNGTDKESTGSSWASVAKKSSSNLLSQDDSQDEALDDVSSKKSYQATTSNYTKSDIPTLSKCAQTYSHGDLQDLSLFPQGSNDVLEVLCSGEPTAGKLLMHFLLFYGRHFDAYTTCIDISGTHHPEYKHKQDSNMHANAHLSPFTVRKAGGTFNPVTEVYTVDPIVVYDPLEGAETNNVARSCYAWENIRWTFEQCYNTLSGVVELGAGSNNNRSRSKTWPQQDNTGSTADGTETSRNVDDLSPLLELLLSF